MKFQDGTFVKIFRSVISDSFQRLTKLGQNKPWIDVIERISDGLYGACFRWARTYFISYQPLKYPRSCASIIEFVLLISFQW